MTAGDFYFVRPDEMYNGGAVSGGAATSYTDEALVDGKPGVPTRATNGSPTWTIANTALTVSLVAVCNHNIDAARNIVFGSGITKTIVGPTLPPSRIPLNPWGIFSPVSASSVTLAISSNTADVIIGEVVIGKYRTLERAPAPGVEFKSQYGTVRHDSEFNSLMPYDKGVVFRTFDMEVTLTDTGLADVQDWWDSTRGSSKPSLIVPNSNVQDAWLVEFSEFTYAPSSKNRNTVKMAFIEYPRSRW